MLNSIIFELYTYSRLTGTKISCSLLYKYYYNNFIISNYFEKNIFFFVFHYICHTLFLVHQLVVTDVRNILIFILSNSRMHYNRLTTVIHGLIKIFVKSR